MTEGLPAFTLLPSGPRKVFDAIAAVIGDGNSQHARAVAVAGDTTLDPTRCEWPRLSL